ncbi:type II toxin-antitoxin system RelE/ParE family toxin [uncultured Fibrobacter sp.]|uniref:type II toxin-antitoxin system RelE/ParE family toxin n=1 Tax=uncultured Fibrobacter sp. TaxID=261512 RepID=UPI0025FDBE57|nr:type II toxin-antitoxin system RelE/ParE family toxin [uncultured Fibrobacter sp.]
MNVIWHAQAEKALIDAAVYIQNHFGKRFREKFVGSVRQTEHALRLNPYLGKLEPLLMNRVREYRSIVVGTLNKIIYYVDSDVIYIADFWDVRREPKALAEQTNVFKK